MHRTCSTKRPVACVPRFTTVGTKVTQSTPKTKKGDGLYKTPSPGTHASAQIKRNVEIEHASFTVRNQLSGFYPTTLYPNTHDPHSSFVLESTESEHATAADSSGDESPHRRYNTDRKHKLNQSPDDKDDKTIGLRPTRNGTFAFAQVLPHSKLPNSFFTTSGLRQQSPIPKRKHAGSSSSSYRTRKNSHERNLNSVFRGIEAADIIRRDSILETHLNIIFDNMPPLS